MTRSVEAGRLAVVAVAVLIASLAYMLYIIAVRGLLLTANGFLAASMLAVGVVVSLKVLNDYRSRMLFKPPALLAYLALASLIAAIIVSVHS